MTEWTTDELDGIDAADELEITSLRSDGTLRSQRRFGSSALATTSTSDPSTGAPPVGSAVHRCTTRAEIRAGGVEKNVTFVDGDSDVADRIDDAYRTKYRRYAASIVDTTITPAARATTLKLVPRS